MMQDFVALANDIKKLVGGKRIIYVPNPGNYGDGLIRYATKKFLHDFEIGHTEINIGYHGGRFSLIPFLLKRKDFFFIYGGGGAWGHAYGFGIKNAKFIARYTNQFVVLPSTFELGLPENRGRFYRRDHGPSKITMPNSLFCHDMAFYLAHHTPLYRAPKDDSVGNLFRTDSESAREMTSLPGNNRDVSLLGDHMSNGDDFLRLVASYATIHTDRLHVSIAGAIAGTNVKLHRGNYFKIEEIYKASMTEYFRDNVELVS